jgi:mercuric ion binding protein
LFKKEGVLDAKVIFTDSIANIEFDANATSKKDLIAFINGIAGGNLYKASEHQ